jgi:hypothetical protein
MTSPEAHKELRDLLELYCENQISQEQVARLEQLAAADEDSLRFYMDYIELHGNLIWDLAASAATQPSALLSSAPTPSSKTVRRPAIIGALTACLAIAAFATFALRNTTEQPGPGIAGTDAVATAEDEPKPKPPRSVQPLELESVVKNDTPIDTQTPDQLEPAAPTAVKLPSNQIVAEVNRLIKQSWVDAQIVASPPADNDSWTRRAFLNVVGRIPSPEELQRSRTQRSREAVINELLADTGYARFWSTNWTNLLIGRSSERGVNRPGFEKFLRDRFAHNAPWNQTVSELIAAEGTTEDNGATNFLVAHLNSQAVPATAVTARAFLGIQVQCTQCHDHPFNTELKQDQFWTLNSFFKQTKRERKFSESVGPQFVLTSANVGGPTHYETRGGLMKSAFPAFDGQSIDAGAEVNRREELARIITEEDNDQLARSMVNRVWAHFFGHGFTSPIDDMGPHNPPSHPEVLTLLADQFRLANFDLNQLITWIVLSDAYALDSKFADNEIDAPSRGEVPLFSRMYVRAMSPEQVYDSLLVATQADQTAGFDWDTAGQRRHKWIQQFLFAHGNEENTEESTFDGSITQALSLMNSELVQNAVSTKRGSLLAKILGNRTAPIEQLKVICQAVLSRDPSTAEVTAFRKLLRRERTTAARTALMQDVLWAYLNSNEFILVH